MAAIDFFCAPDDRHRVILLVDLLEKAGQPVVLRTEPLAEPSRPCLIACTRRAFREPWISALFTGARQVAALRLDDAPLPGPAAQIIDLQAWPARSADRQVGPLVDWLAGGAPEPAPFGLPADRAAASFGQRPRRRDSLGRKVRTRLADSNLGGLLVLVGLLVGVAALLGTVEPDRPGAPREAAAEPIAAVEIPRANAAVGSARGERESAGEPVSRAGASPARAAATGVGASSTAAVTAGRADNTADPPPIVRAVALRRSDSLQYLCKPRTLAAAKAWGGVLHWSAATPPFDRACAEPA